MAKQPLKGQGLIIQEWTRGQPDADVYLTTHDTRKRQTSLLPAGFEPANPASDRPQTHTLVRAAPGTGSWFILTNIFEI